MSLVPPSDTEELVLRRVNPSGVNFAGVAGSVRSLTVAPTDGNRLFRRSLEPRVDIFFTTSTWCGTPQIREPHKCTQLVWAKTAALLDDTLDFVSQAITNARQGRHFHEHGWGAALQSRQHNS